jgi:hypothetical protein
MASPLTLRVAEWIMGRQRGASILEVMKEFQLTEERATQVMLRIRGNPKRYTSRWTGHPGPLGKGELPPRLFVTGIIRSVQGAGLGRPNQPFRATPVAGSNLPILEFNSGLEMGAAGYARCSVWRAIAAGRPYAGYIWERIKGDTHD